MATARHFAGYSETQGGRDASEADISHRKLRSWFLPPFEKIAREGVLGTFMLGYQTTDGVPITLNNWLLDVLRGEWGYEGVLITDWDNVGRMVRREQQIQPDITRVGEAQVRAGNEMIMTTPTFFEGALDAIEKGMLDESELDGAVRHILTTKFELGLFEDRRRPPATSPSGPAHRHSRAPRRQPGHHAPLHCSPRERRRPPARLRGKRVAVVGPLADDAQAQLVSWAGSSGQVNWMLDGQPRA